METTNKEVLHLVFTLDTGKTGSVTVANPKEGVTLADCQGVAATVVANDAIVASGDAHFAAFKEAYLVKTQTTPLA